MRIDRIDVLHYDWPDLELEIDCGGGTYIRSIARDVGETLGCGGFVQTLVRTRTGPFTLAEAIEPAATIDRSRFIIIFGPQSTRSPACPGSCLTPARLRPSPQGRRLCTQDLDAVPIAAGQVALLDPQGILIALGEFDPSQGWIQPRKVLI